mgnify:FL=1
MFDIVRYTESHAEEWNTFVKTSKNGTFLMNRGYMDYHSDRFLDHSLLFFKGSRLYALLPANEEGDTLFSHRGLTYGGLLMDKEVCTADVLTLFDELNVYLRQQGFRRVCYRAIPWVYHRLPSEEDLYAMFWRCGARLQQRMSGTVIFMDAGLRWRKDHRRRLKQAQEAGIRVERNGSMEAFWPILNDNLQKKFGASSVHTLDEILLLKSRFPDEIVQYNAWLGDVLVGGITFYVMGHVLHGQYSGTNDTGKELGAMEAIYDQVMYHDYPHIRYLDFGTSNEEGGLILNEGLIAHKEGYGGRTVMYDTYEWKIED